MVTADWFIVPNAIKLGSIINEWKNHALNVKQF